MASWNELHYQRAQEFARLIGELASGATPSAGVMPPLPAASPPAPARPVPPAPGSVPAAAPPTAGSLFNKMPWKK
jgi:hypothetical protein